ncbi:hypothetical protein PR048_000770 [Dryococelus australis]|uniref:Uncharacterized protein n=1 Tax=Dryococelus australis TaxID=614101 RepID=A0ABQ9IFJ7_9NEOP|nr:hypothetical protein PR048_000770 [Dryococelus australis]
MTVRTAFNKLGEGNYISPDKRGTHTNRPHAIPHKVKDIVGVHVDSIPKIESHYLRKQSKRHYLEGDLSYSKMYRLIMDKEKSLEANSKMVCAVFDMQKFLQTPMSEVSVFYYKRKLNVYNLTIYDMASKDGNCYMLYETIANRGANEVASCLLDFIAKHKEKGKKKTILAVRIEIDLYFLTTFSAFKHYKIDISHKFLEKGHTQNEGDCIYSLIERREKGLQIFTPGQWYMLVRSAKVTGQPYIMTEMD